MTRRLAIMLCFTLLATSLFATHFLPADLTSLRREFVDAIKKKDLDRVRAGAEQLAAEGSATAAEVMIADGLLCDDPALEKIVRDVLGKLPASAAFEWLCTQCTQHKSEAVRDQLIQVLAPRSEKSAFAAVLTGLFDRSDAVKTGAILALEKKDNRGALPHLIRALEYQEDRELELGQVANELRRVLNKWTGKDLFGSEEYQELWRKHEDELLDPTNKRKKDPLGEIVWEKRGTSITKKVPKFFGQEILSMHVVFVLDTSISMNIEDPPPPEVDEPETEEGRPGGGTTVGGGRKTGGGEGKQYSGSRQRLKRVQNELVRMISNLPADFRFNVISFDDKVEVFSKGLQPADSQNKRKAISFVRKFKADGETWTDRGLETAFESAGVRTIVLLSDGMPYRRIDPIHVPTLLDWVAERNRFEHIEIHTIGFRSTSRNVGGFLRSLAKKNRGSYTEIP